MTSARARRVGRLLIWAALYAAFVTALWSVRISVTDRNGRAWELRPRQVWNLAARSVRSRAPDAYPLYLGAVACLVLCAPAAAWRLARVGGGGAGANLAATPEDVVPFRVSEPGLPPPVWIAAAGAACVAAVIVMTPPSRVVDFRLPSGEHLRLANGFGDGAHALFVARAERLTASLQNGEPLAWVAHHQGGYPMESAPSGVAWLTTSIHLASGGALPVAYGHTLGAILLFLLPAAAFVPIARRDGWPASVPAIAAILHVVIPGAAASGGYRTLVDAGRVDSVAGAACVIAFLPILLTALRSGRLRDLALAAFLAGAATWINPVFAVGCAIAALAAAAAVRVCEENDRPRRVLARTVTALAWSAALAAPLWTALLGAREAYPETPSLPIAGVNEYLFTWLEAVTPPLFAVAIVGAAYVYRWRRTGGIAVLITVALLVLVSAPVAGRALIPYADVAPLIGVQRLLTLFLAAVGLHAGGRVLARWAVRGAMPRAGDLAAGALLCGVVLVFAGPWPTMRPASKGLSPPRAAARGETADLAQALAAARVHAPRPSAILVAGDPSDALWAPVLQHGLFFYTDPAWHWRKAAPPSYSPVWDEQLRAAVPEFLASASLRARGIGAVVLPRAAGSAPRALASLEHVWTGGYFDVFAVRGRAGVVDWPGHVATVDVSDRQITARGLTTGGEVDVRRNWHPRWTARLNGAPVAVRETAMGFMKVAAPAGPIELALRYEDGPAVVAGRLIALGAALAGLASFVFGGRR